MDVVRFIKDATAGLDGSSVLGQLKVLHAMLDLHFPNAPITLPALRKWYDRKAIPGEWVVRVARAAEQEGRPLDVAKYDMELNMEKVTERIADNIEQACERLGISKTLIYKELKAGRLKAFKTGRRTVITRQAQDEWLNSLSQVGAGS